PIDIVKNGGALPPEVYEGSLVVAASSLPGVLNIDLLKPGTLVVDYSFPPVFRVDSAIQRFTERHDILFTTGGELRMPELVKETIYLPEDMGDFGDGVEQRFLQFLASRDSHEITGCILVSLLTHLAEEVEPTLGLLENEDALAHYEYLEEFGVTPAKLQMPGFFLPDSGVESFRKQERGSSTTR
ncbi:MAG: hypothetical protein AAF357_07670, partial [Verrucomicrobiota bacterium]